MWDLYFESEYFTNLKPIIRSTVIWAIVYKVVQVYSTHTCIYLFYWTIVNFKLLILLKTNIQYVEGHMQVMLEGGIFWERTLSNI
jgi:hypothetical protein